MAKNKVLSMPTELFNAHDQRNSTI